MDRKEFLKNSLLATGTIFLPSSVWALDKKLTENISNGIENGEPEFSYSNPFTPIWCEDDDYSQAVTKPTIFYKEVVGTKMEIENMPAYKTQSELGECRAYSLAAILQQYVNTKWKSDIPDPKNPPADMAISHFGLMAYTNQIPNQANTFQPNQDDARSMREIIDNLSKNGNQLILENCKPFENLYKEFSLKGNKGLELRDEFLNYLNEIFKNLKNTNELNIKDCTQEVNRLNKFVNLNFNQKALKKALTKRNLAEFLFSLFFDECKRENFPAGFRAMGFPLDSMNVTIKEMIEQVIKGIKYSKPVILPSICVSQNIGEECNLVHSLVISGYKQVKNNESIKSVFKVHNSWGIEWQKMNNDGWIDAEILCQNTSRIKSENDSYRIASNSVMWIE